ncbi:MAG: hypothetical protein WCV50_05410 [Patescibacteria group bacterium]|jgi:hypothetical protein
MAPLDGITAPKNLKRIPPKAKNNRKQRGVKFNEPKKNPEPKLIKETKPVKSLQPGKPASKEKTMWLLVVIIAAVIFVGWIFAFPYITKTNSDKSSYFDQVGSKLDSLWNNIKVDLLNIKETVNNNSNTNVNSQPASPDNLEQRIFPQFKDPNNQ